MVGLDLELVGNSDSHLALLETTSVLVKSTFLYTRNVDNLFCGSGLGEKPIVQVIPLMHIMVVCRTTHLLCTN